MGAKKNQTDETEVLNLKKTLKEKEELIKKLLKENVDLKSQVASKSKAVDILQ